MPLAPLQDPWQRVEIHQDKDVSSQILSWEAHLFSTFEVDPDRFRMK